MIKLIINADDFGMSVMFNKNILELLEKGFIKSTTVMVNRIAGEQDRQIRQLTALHATRNIGIGLHLEVAIEKPLAPQIKEQYQKFTALFGFLPSHLDIHKLIDNREIITAVNTFAEEYGLPVRNHGIPSTVKQTTHQAFFCTGLTVEKIINFLQCIQDGESSELITHPGAYDPASTSSLNREREDDYQTIRALQAFLFSQSRIKNVSYREL